ncbi:MAG: flagellar export protein FliJ [Sulfurimicrobium sp.]|nr:flagellar export protein FliJ [Sulfurimicrobium sp.]MDP1705362.1 flagellar export protein FliJ [Sulfurimicrobium sp.]MDP2199528.1 flagellar export protein FliJ [Sulfurimicrobium sp.]MDP3688226.1 flagellar export protein FliJ [Sulfurimicrobium sp.]
MARKFPLQPLLDISRNNMDQAAKNLQALRVRWNGAEEKLKQLLAYRETYRERLRDSGSGGTSAMALRDFQLFLVKLDTAIKLQQDEVARCQARWNDGQQEWLRQRGKLKAFDVLSQRHRHAEEKRENQIEQKEQDEFSSKQRDRTGKE